MKFFVDTADVAAIRELNDLGMVDGVTTNPSIIAKSGRDIKEVTAEICAMIPGKPVSAETVALDAEGMIAEGRELARIADNIAIKVPLTWEGLKACKVLSGEGRMVNVTLCFSANQALLAAKAGATFISPFIGRLDDINIDGLQLIADIRTISGNNVNMRMGPGTRYNVVAKLRRETEVQVLQNPGNGWLKLRVVESGRVGWMAEFLVTAAN